MHKINELGLSGKSKISSGFILDRSDYKFENSDEKHIMDKFRIFEEQD